MKKNKLRYILENNLPSVSTRMWSTWPLFTEAAASSRNFDYVEYDAEYSPFTQYDLENICRAAELHNTGTMIKVDLQNRAYVMQKALASGFQSILLTDIKTAEEIKESLYVIRPDTPKDCGRFGYPSRRWSGFQLRSMNQMDYAKMIREIVVATMIEKKEAIENIEEICSIPGVDMVQFGPSDYSMSCGWNACEHADELKEIEERMIKIALKHGVQPRCEINSIEEVMHYIDIGVRHFCIGDEMNICSSYWNNVGGEMKKIADSLKKNGNF